MSEKRKKEEKIILGYEPWGEEIVPECFFLRQAGGCDEYLEEPVDQEMAKPVWDLIACEKVQFSVNWGKSCYFSEFEGYYIVVAHFVFRIIPEWAANFREAGIPVELSREERFKYARRSDLCPKHGGHMTHWGEWSCCGDFSFLM